MIPLIKCRDRGIYRIVARNLTVGVFKLETSGFIGIRLKFGDRYLFEEYHFDCRPPHGTVRPIALIAMLPEEFELKEYLQSVDQDTRRPVAFDQKIRPDNGDWGWYWIDTGKPDPQREIKAVAVRNKLLFEYLDKLN